KNHGSEYQPEPPDRRRRRAFPQVLIPYRLRIRVAAVVAQEVDTQHQPAKTHEADNRQDDDPAAPEIIGLVRHDVIRLPAEYSRFSLWCDCWTRCRSR